MFKTNYLYPFLLVLAIVLRWEHELFNPKFWSDEMAQYIAAKSIMDNHGPCLPSVMAEDLSSLVYLPLKQFPEGYSYLIAPIWQVTGNLYAAVIFWQWLTILVYLFAWWLTYRLFETELNKSVILSFLLITAFSLSPWLYYKPTDLLAVSFYWLGVSIFANGINRSSWTAIFSACCAGFLFFVCTTLRYAYQPIMPFTVVVMLGTGLIIKNKRITISSIGCGSIMVALSMCYQLFLKTPGNLPSEAQGATFYWENLWQADLTIFNKPLFDDRMLHSIFFKLGGENLAILSKTTVSLFILAVLVSLLIRKEALQKLLPTSSRILFVTVSSLTALATGGLLYVLSALSKPQENDYLHTWTYVRETRYYAPVFVLVLFFLLFLIFEKKKVFKWKKIIQMGCWVLLAISVPYYLAAKYDTIRSDPDYFRLGEPKIMNGESKSEVLPELKKWIRESTMLGIPPVYMAANRTVRYAQLSGATVLFPDFGKLKNVKTSRKVAVLVHISNNDPYDNSELKEFIKQNRHETLYLSNSDSLYRFIITPN